MQLAVNASYSVNAAASTVTLTLPATANVNDTIGITGTSNTAWTVAQNAGQSIVTTGLKENVAPGAAWTPVLPPKVWHWISTDATGEVMLAGEADGGFLNVSTNGGQTWSQASAVVGGAASPIPGIWISSDITPADVSPQGKAMVAAQYGGHIYMSRDSGATWQQLTDPAVNAAAGLNFESVTISSDGQHLAAVVQSTGAGTATPDGLLTYSNDGGSHWTVVAPGGMASDGKPNGLPAGNYLWRAVDNSSDGTVIMAVSHDGEIFRSIDSGAHWTAIAVTVAGKAVPDTSWYRVKLSADGNTVAIAANSFGTSPGTDLFVSRDGGQTWFGGAGLPASAEYTAIAMTPDGKTIAASLSNSNHTTDPKLTGAVMVSSDGGANFTALTLPGSDTDWRALAMSADGDKLWAAAGRFSLPTPPFVAGHTGQLYSSLGNRTSIGIDGSITGRQNDSLTLQYLGNNQWSATRPTGTAPGPVPLTLR